MKTLFYILAIIFFAVELFKIATVNLETRPKQDIVFSTKSRLVTETDKEAFYYDDGLEKWIIIQK
jgi:uncharacterized protein YvpB